MFIHAPQKKLISFSVYVGDFEMEGKKNNLKPHVRHIEERKDPEEPMFSLDQEILVCTHRECKMHSKIGKERKNLVESLISAGFIKQRPGCGGLHTDIVAWTYDMEGHAQKMHGKTM